MSQKMKKPEAGKKQKLGPGRKTWHNFKQSIPVIIGVLLLISLFSSLLTPENYARLFRGNPWFDSLVGAVIGSISGGNALLSYILGGEFRQQRAGAGGELRRPALGLSIPAAPPLGGGIRDPAARHLADGLRAALLLVLHPRLQQEWFQC